MILLVLCFFLNRTKDYTAPVNFVSAGLRKTAAEEKQEQGSDDSDADGEPRQPPPPPPRAAAPKKVQLQTVRVVFHTPIYSYNLSGTEQHSG